MRCLALAALLVCPAALAQESAPPLEPALIVDWPEYLTRHDITWTVMPRRWFDAPFLGNGMLGTLVRQTGDRAVRFDVGHSYVHDQRRPDDYRVRVPEILNRGRLPIGHFLLHTTGRIEGGEIRLDLWNAEARGILRTEKGSIRWRALVHARDMAYLVEIEPDAGEASCRFTFMPEKAESCRFTNLKDGLPQEFLEAYPPNPKPRIVEQEDLTLCLQELAAGGATATAWMVRHEENGCSALIVSVEHAFGEDADPGGLVKRRAAANIRTAAGADRAQWIADHRAWWHDYYPRSFLSPGDPVWESFYWIQMYKLASATRSDRALIDNQGPWLQPTNWNGTWWNLNVQLSYSPVYTANRLSLGESLTRHLERNFRNLIDNVEAPFRHDSAGLGRCTGMQDLAGRAGRPGGWAFPNEDVGSEAGNLAWTCHNVYLHYRHTMDERLLLELLYPLLKRAVNYYRHFLEPGEDGRLHLPPTQSPEYGNAPDCNYDLSLIRWGCRTLIDLARRQGLEEPLMPEWERILAELAENPQNENGFMIGRGVGYDRSHRHWSHLLMIYPLRLVTPDTGQGALIRKSLERWHGLEGGMTGYSFTGGASFSALLGDGDRALDFLDGLLPYLGASTMYFEGGRSRALPVMETPLHGAQVLQEMLLQSHCGTIRVFPAVPDAWPDARFFRLRAEGAFLASAERAIGRTRWIHLHSLAGEPCRVKTDMVGPMKWIAPDGVSVTLSGDGVAEIAMQAGQSALLYPGEKAPGELKVRPAVPIGPPCPFGLKE
jgi:hypothetical protein